MNNFSQHRKWDPPSSILGIDPGLAETGWGVIMVNPQDGTERFRAAGSISTHNKDILSDRLAQIFAQIRHVIQLYSPKAVAIEKVFLNRNPESTMKLCHGRAAAMLAASEAGLIVEEFHNREIKSAVVGKGNAQKQQMSAMIRFLLPGIDTTNEHALDALCVAVCAQHHRQAAINLKAKQQS